jgi:DNA-damage-inducible protein D
MTQTPDFDSIKQENPYGVEYWSARDLMPLLGYKKWERFEDAIKRAMTSCEQSGNIVKDHFPNVGKVIKAGKGAAVRKMLFRRIILSVIRYAKRSMLSMARCLKTYPQLLQFAR